jgi:HAD superfamily hydrolase (TIGR01484 family)
MGERMSTLPIQLISTDFDGTLHAEFENPPVPEELQELLGELQRHGAKWVINTGRDLTSVMEGIARSRLRVKPDYLVVVEREIYMHHNSQYVECDPWNKSCRRDHAEVFSRVRQDIPRLMAWINERFSATLYEDPYSPFCMIAESDTDADQIQAFLEDYCREIPPLTFVRNSVYARFSHTGYNKGTALGEIARQLGVRSKNVFAAGDHLNDIPMLTETFAGLLTAPDNAIPKVKEHVSRQEGYISHQPWGHGVARGLEFYLEKGGWAFK